MKVNVLYGYRGRLTDEQYLPAGEHELDDTLAAYLIENGHAVLVNDVTHVQKVNESLPDFVNGVGWVYPGSEKEARLQAIDPSYNASVVTAPGGPVIVPSDDLGADGDRDAVDADVDLSAMTKTQLIEYAAERGLTLSDRLTKQAMIDAIEEL